MKFKTDGRYTAIQLLEVIGCYILGVMAVLFLLNNDDPIGFIGSSSAALLFVYFLCFFPRSIQVGEGMISFKKEYGYQRVNLCLSDIVDVQTDTKYYNTVTIVTRNREVYRLHPRDIESLKELIR